MNIINKNLKFGWEITTRRLTTHGIFHHVAGDANLEEIHAYHKQKGWAGFAYHFFVDKGGNVYEGRPLNTVGGHTQNWNYCSIGICFQGNFDINQMGIKQLIAGQELVSYITELYPNIIFGKHSEYGATACPGKYFPFDDMITPLVTEPIDTDVEYSNTPSEWARMACDLAISNGIIHGDENGIYGWRDPLTLERLLVILDRLNIL